MTTANAHAHSHIVSQRLEGKHEILHIRTHTRARFFVRDLIVPNGCVKVPRGIRNTDTHSNVIISIWCLWLGHIGMGDIMESSSTTHTHTHTYTCVHTHTHTNICAEPRGHWHTVNTRSICVIRSIVIWHCAPVPYWLSCVCVCVHARMSISGDGVHFQNCLSPQIRVCDSVSRGYIRPEPRAAALEAILSRLWKWFPNIMNKKVLVYYIPDKLEYSTSPWLCLDLISSPLVSCRWPSFLYQGGFWCCSLASFYTSH